ncbi:hypothetical protein SDC9_175340 [bioreactor metagenome]|uniref:Uncharacterized protein n=1 Tax=bioreactor metagenome TaxID=1076179 RepID=A0A645GNZ7_9ZZZZ
MSTPSSMNPAKYELGDEVYHGPFREERRPHRGQQRHRNGDAETSALQRQQGPRRRSQN